MSRGHGTSTARSRRPHRKNVRRIQAVRRANADLGTYNEQGYLRKARPKTFVPKDMTLEEVLNAPI